MEYQLGSEVQVSQLGSRSQDISEGGGNDGGLGLRSWEGFGMMSAAV